MTTGRSGSSLADLLERNARRGTGCMQVADKGQNSALIFFLDGQVYAVHIDGQRPNIPLRLRTAGALPPAQYADAVAADPADPNAGLRSIESGYQHVEVLSLIHQELVLSALNEIDTWTGLRSRFRDGVTTDEFCTTPLDVSDLVQAIAHRADYGQRTWEQIAADRPVDTTAAVRMPDADTSATDLTPDAACLLAAIDGQRTVAELAQACGLTRMEVIHLLTDLVAAGTVGMFGLDEPRPQPRKPAARPAGRLPLSRPVTASASIPPPPPARRVAPPPSAPSEPAPASPATRTSSHGETDERRRVAREEAARLEAAARRAREEADRIAAEEVEALIAAERQARVTVEQELAEARRAREEAEQAAERIRWTILAEQARDEAMRAKAERGEAAEAVADEEVAVARATEAVNAARADKDAATADFDSAENAVTEAQQAQDEAIRDLTDADAAEAQALDALMKAQQAYEQAHEAACTARAAANSASTATEVAVLAEARWRVERVDMNLTGVTRDLDTASSRLTAARSRLETADSAVETATRRVEETQARLASL